MTIIGIAGCTGLMLTGFGIRDSVDDIPSAQFDGIFKYDVAITLSNTDGLEKLEEYLNNNEKIENYVKVCATTGEISNGTAKINTTVFVPDSLENYQNAYNLTDYETNETLKIDDDGIIITDKAAEILGVKAGDNITFIDGDDVYYTFKVKNIAKNHVSHYVYMSKDFYEKNLKEYKTDIVYFNTKNISDEAQDQISKDILGFDGVASVSLISSLMKSVSDMLNTMNYVVVILIVASAMLDFVVLYNLANINIAERQREIATLKVLGFYDKEVDNYINKENIIFTILGVALGLVFGTFLTSAIIGSIEIDKENKIITTKDSGEEGVLGDDCLIDCSQIPMIYCNYDTQDVVDITLDDLQVGDEIILAIRSSEIENLQKEDDNKAKIAVEQLQLGTQRIK